MSLSKKLIASFLLVAVLPNGLLFYPVQYEGEESSRNVFGVMSQDVVHSIQL